MPPEAPPRPRFIDSHVHLASYPDPAQCLALAGQAPILLLTAGTGMADSLKGLELCDRNPPLVRSFVGLHPSEVLKERATTWVEEALQRASGLGEVGLDPKYSETGPGTPQMAAFEAQLRLAEASGKPVQVHSRGAERACLDTLGSFRLGPVLLHWFQGEPLASEAAERGYYVSVGPALLVSKKIRRIAGAWPPDRILAESDGPVGFAGLGGAAGPFAVPSVVFELSRILGTGFEEAARATVANGLAFLGSKA